MKNFNSTPKQDGFRMPGEFEKHAGCWIIWPERTDNWRYGAKPAQLQFVEVAKAIAEFEPVTVAANFSQYVNARSMLPPHIRVVEVSNNDSWVRDLGATFVNNGEEVRGICWGFNAWGGLVDGLYFPWDKDQGFAQKMCEIERKDYYLNHNFILEGGSIHVDGEGTLVVTKECLLSDGRNPHMSQIEIEEMLKQYLNVEVIIWLEDGIYLDETNGHVDNIFNYVRPGEVCIAWTDDQNDPQYKRSFKALQVLENAIDAKGRKLKIHKLYTPSPVLITKEQAQGVDAINGTMPRNEGDRQAASYANYYTANGGIVFPLFDDQNDEKAREALQIMYPSRKIVGVKASEIILGGGNIHCITQQIPLANSK